MDERTKEGIEKGTVAPRDLPAGDDRREALKIAKDALEERAPKEMLEGGTINPEALEEDREILANFNPQLNIFEVTNAREGFKYLLCPDEPMKIIEAQTRAKQYLGAKHTGFVIVQGDDPEAPEWKDSRGYRVIGDCILMCIPIKEAEAIERAIARVMQLRNSPDAVQLLALAEKYRRQVGDKVAAHVIVNQTPRDYFQTRGRGGIPVARN